LSGSQFDEMVPQLADH